MLIKHRKWNLRNIVDYKKYLYMNIRILMSDIQKINDLISQVPFSREHSEFQDEFTTLVVSKYFPICGRRRM